MYSRKSVFRQMPPNERKKKIFETFFPKRKDDEFDNSKGFTEFVEWYLDFTKSYKEKMYENHLADIEQMAINISKISFQKKKKIVRTVKVKVGKDVDEDVARIRSVRRAASDNTPTSRCTNTSARERWRSESTR